MRMCQAFADAGHQVTLLGWSPSTDAPDPIDYYGLRGGFRIERLCLDRGRRTSRWQLRLGSKVRRLSKEIHPDLVYSRLTREELFYVPRTIPIIYEMHSLGPIAEQGAGMLFRWLVRRKNFRRIIVTTDSLAQELEARLGRLDIVIARLSAEPPVEISSDVQQAFRQQTLQGTKFKFHVGYTGALDSKDVRGTDIICKMAAHLGEAAFHIVGGDPETVDYWRNFAATWNHNANIFFYGHRNPREIPYFLGCFDVVLAPLQYRPLPRAPLGQNTSPLKLPQYKAYGKAIVASDLPAHRELLCEDRTALLVAPADISAWVGAVKRLLSEPDLRAALGARARADYFKEHTPEKRVTRILQGL